MKVTQVKSKNGSDKAQLATLRSLNPASMSEIPLSLEDAVIGYLGDRGERTFHVEREITL